ncbi:MAG: beta-N-acetylhexosaminidase [Clostridium sp.]|nr:beta-N-acetylhexosaminidase [Clostridium sp.]
MKNKYQTWLASVMLFCVASGADARIEHLLPKPKEVTPQAMTPFALGRAVKVEAEVENPALSRFLEEVGCTVSDAADAVVSVTMVESIPGAHLHNLAGYPDEAYQLNITTDRVEIRAVTPTGVIRAAQTLTQLAEGYDGAPELEALTLTDWPAFKLRGYLHDVGRSFIDVDELKKEIDLLSRFKVNTFHFHLTENQAWRFEVKAYPQLTSTESMTRFAGQYYTQEQCREIERYAAERGMMVIPEIDMPGHSQAFKRAMGHSMQTDEGVAELKVILEEVAEVFPNARYIDIGADEETITYPDFLKIMTDKVHELGRKVVVWNPIRGVTINKEAGFDMTHMWSTSGRVVSGMPNIDSRYNYVNHFDVFADVVGIYKSNIYYTDKGTDDVAGAITALWNDRKTPDQTDIIRQNNFYANALATVERAWMGGGERYIETGGTMLPSSGDEYDAFADWERRFLFHKAHSLRNEPIPYVKQTQVRWRITDAFPNDGNADMQFPPETEGLKDAYEWNGGIYSTGMATGAGIYLRHTWGGTIPTYFQNPQTNTTAYAWTYVYSPTEREAGALVEFQNYGRSENDRAPEAGKWDRKGSRLWVNDEEIMPPVWDNTGVGINSEVDLRNENFAARAPERIHLRKGWNKVFMKLPYNPNGLRLAKWMFTFVLTDMEGRDAMEDLIYSPNKCMDDAAEQVAAAIAEARKERNASVREDVVGYYPEELAADLDAVLDEVNATLENADMTPEERAGQISRITEALETFRIRCETSAVNQPREGVWYQLICTARGGRFATAHGIDADIVGETGTSVASVWKFISREDGGYDIVNYSDGSYISPAAAYNTALKTVAEVPSTGWEIKRSNVTGRVIIVNGTAQFNQTNNGSLGWKVYNWGGGENTSDDGCQYTIEEADDLPEEVTLPPSILTLTNLEFDGTSPWRIPDDKAKPVLEAEALTVAVDFTLQNNSSEMTLVGSSCSTVDQAFVGVNVASNNYGVRYNNGGGRYTTSATVGTARHQIVVTMQPDAPQYAYYIDGTKSRDVTSGDCVAFGRVAGIDGLYIGGLVCSDNANKYPLYGTVHSVQFFPESLSAQQVALIRYDELTPTGIAVVPGSVSTPISVHDGIIRCDVPFAVYTLSGTHLPSGSRLPSGLYVVRAEAKTFKVQVP